METAKSADKEVDLQLPHQFYRSDRNPFVAALSDVYRGLISVRLWVMLAWEGFVDRYRRSYLGALWAIISFMIFTIAILFFLGMIRGRGGNEFTEYTVIGFLMYQWVSTFIIEGAQVFLNAGNWLRSTRIHMSIFVFSGIARTVIVLAFNAVGAFIILIASGYSLPDGAIWAIPGLLVILLNAVWIYLLLGVVVAKFRDFGHLVTSIMRMSFFITPVMWEIPEEGGQRLVALLNPLTYYIEIVRLPLLSGEVPWDAWTVVWAMTAAGYILAILVYGMFRRRVAMWL